MEPLELTTPQDLADLLRAKRKKAGLTLEEAAKLMHLGASTLRRWEAGYLDGPAAFVNALETLGNEVRVVQVREPLGCCGSGESAA
jgi:transcriptional regulator with XRE-family HTH domain